jgi:hypothetical protein
MKKILIVCLFFIQSLIQPIHLQAGERDARKFAHAVGTCQTIFAVSVLLAIGTVMNSGSGFFEPKLMPKAEQPYCKEGSVYSQLKLVDQGGIKEKISTCHVYKGDDDYFYLHDYKGEDYKGVKSSEFKDKVGENCLVKSEEIITNQVLGCVNPNPASKENEMAFEKPSMGVTKAEFERVEKINSESRGSALKNTCLSVIGGGLTLVLGAAIGLSCFISQLESN